MSNTVDLDLRENIGLLFSSYQELEPAIELIILVTSDGFPICTHTRQGKSVEADKIAAAASTLYSVSNAVANQILTSDFETAFVQTNRGNMAFVAFNKTHGDYVLAMSANNSINIGKLRLRIKGLSDELIGKLA